MDKSQWFRVWIAAGLLGIGGSAVADAPSAPDRVDVIAATCGNCHGTDGRFVSAIPPLAGRPADELYARLRAFKRGENDPTVMDRLAGGYSDDELKVVARYFSRIAESPSGDEER